MNIEKIKNKVKEMDAKEIPKIPKSVFEEIKDLEGKIINYEEWKKEDLARIVALKEMWKIEE